MINQGQWTAVYQHTPLQRMAEDAYRLWLGYYADCERYDRTVCTGGRDKDGDARPVGHNERALICAHAATRHAAVTRDLAAARVTPDASFAARRAACVLRFEDAEHELARLTARAERTFMERACAGEFGDLHTAQDPVALVAQLLAEAGYDTRGAECDSDPDEEEDDEQP